MSNSKRAANCAARSTRRLSSTKVSGETARSNFRSRSRRPPKGSSSSPSSGSSSIALTVKSRRRAASSTVIEGSPSMMNARWPRPALRSRRGRLTSKSRPSLYTVNASPTTLTRPSRSSSSRKTAGSMPYTSTSQSFATRPIRRSLTHPPTNSARPPSPRTARASLRIFSGTGEGIGKKDSEGRRRPARLNGVAVAEINVVFVGVVFVSVLVRLVRISVEVVNENLHAARRGQTTDDLHALDARALRRRVPQLYPEAARVAVYDEGRAVQHHRHRLGHRAVAQLFE